MSQDREERLQRYLDGNMDAAAREAFEEELLSDGEFMADAYDEVTVREALVEAAQARRVAFRPRRRPQAVAFLALAAAASIAFFAFILPRPGGDEVFRGGVADAPEAIQPVGELEGSPELFLWTRDPGAVRYRLEIFNTAGARLHLVTTADTLFSAADGPALPKVGTWRATSLDSVGIGVRSTGEVEFSFP